MHLRGSEFRRKGMPLETSKHQSSVRHGADALFLPISAVLVATLRA